MTGFLTLDDADARGKTVLVRGDLNVPVQDGKVSDTTRLDRLAPTLTELASKGAKVVVLSHFGRPKGKRKEEDSLKPIAQALSKAANAPVAFADDCVGPVAQKVIDGLKPGGIAVLENLRFYPGEEDNDPAFAQQLAALGDIYVNDAFSAAHRAHASTHALAGLLPAYAGRLMEAELKALTAALEKPERPVIALVGGAKISTKLDLLNNLVTKVDKLVLGGGMANTFLHAKGVNVGKSLCERDMADQARTIMATAQKHGCEIILPVDGVIAREFKAGAASQVCDVKAIPAEGMMLDIGPATVESLKGVLKTCKTAVWNGPLGAFEIAPFDKGTNDTAKAVAELTVAGKLLSVAGGGDTVAALAHAGVEDKFSYISTAGGAFLEWLEGKELPGVAALSCAGHAACKAKA